MNKYEFTRSIRFSLKGNIEEFEVNDVDDAEEIYAQFLEKYKDLIDSFENAVFVDVKNQKVRNKLELNYKWIRNYAREEYDDIQDKSIKNYTIQDANFLKTVFIDWIENNRKLLEEISDIVNREEENQAKRADLSYNLKQFSSNDYFSFVNEFVQYYSKDLNTSKNINKLKQVTENIETVAQKILQNVAPDQSNGFEVARGSFNYYTINKTSKNIDADIDAKKELLNQSVKVNTQLLKNVGFEDYVKEEGHENINSIPLAEMYDLMKEYKSSQKSLFLEDLREENWKQYTKENTQKVKTNSNIDLDKLKGKKFVGLDALANYAGIEPSKKTKNAYVSDEENAQFFIEWTEENHPLFIPKNIESAKDFLEITEEIKKLGIEKNQAKQTNDYQLEKKLNKQLRDKKIKRGKTYFQGSFVFLNRFKYLELYKNVAMDRGKARAQIRSLEQEKVEARLLKYWTHIIEKDGTKSILLIPKNADNLQKAKIYLDSLDDQDGSINIFSFNSLTLRALDKLMRKNIGKDVEILNEDDENYIKICKKVLRGEYPTIKLDFTGFEDELKNVIDNDYKDKEYFRMALESISYVISKKYLNETILTHLKDKFGAIVLDITSFDLEKKVSNKKEHTLIWEGFWSTENAENNYSTRLNPEVRLFFRKAQENLPKEKQKNRFSKKHLTIAFTLTQNSAQNRIKTAFEETDRLVAITKQFNKDVINPFVKEKGDDLYYYGIDRGNQELASLCVTQFSQEMYEAMLIDGTKKEIRKPIFPKIKTYRIKEDCYKNEKEIIIDKEGNKKEIILMDNPSYFIEDDVFEEVNSPFIDLTTAKLIKGKIILNGDVKTYLNLKESNAKRKLFDVFSQIDIDGKVEYCGDKKHPAWDIKNNKDIFFMQNAFVIKLKKEERAAYQNLCYYPKTLNKYRQKEEMQEILQKYLDNLRGDNKMETITIDRINNLRDAITSNMVGIIAHLFEKYPGIINLENLHSESDIGRHFRNNNENIARRLEWSLYKKFQKIGLVPPQLRQTVFLRKKKKKKDNGEEVVNQFGIIHFVPTKGTSKRCPYCAEKANEEDKDYKSRKFTQHAFCCEKCEFDSQNPKEPLLLIKNSDDVASYNIAKLSPEKKKTTKKRQSGRKNNPFRK